MMYEIPLFSDNIARWEEQVDLGGKRYTLYFSWIALGGFWEMSLADENGAMAAGGIALVPRLRDLLETHRQSNAKLPKGRIFIVNRNDDVKEITRENLNRDFALCYEE